MVVKHCCFGNCNSDSQYQHRLSMRGVFFIFFPKPNKNREKCLRWINACNRKYFTLKNITKDVYTCSKHFVGDRGPTTEHPHPIPGMATSYDVRQLSKQKRKPPIYRSTVLQPESNDDETTIPYGESSSRADSDVIQTVTDDAIDQPACGMESVLLESLNLPDRVCTGTQTSAVLMLRKKLFDKALERNKRSCQFSISRQLTLREHPFLSYANLSKLESKFYYFTGLKLAQFKILFQFLGPAAYKLNYYCKTNKNSEKSPARELDRNESYAPKTSYV